nr:MAG TPA: hypothetical protein [Crassvirales sp.]
MGKRRIGFLRGKPIIEGDPNLVGPNEILQNDAKVITLKVTKLNKEPKPGYPYYTSFSNFDNNFIIPSDPDIMVTRAISEKDGEVKFEPCSGILNAGQPAFIFSKSPKDIVLVATKEQNPILGPNLGLAVKERISLKEVYKTLDSNSLPTDDVNNPANIQIAAISLTGLALLTTQDMIPNKAYVVLKKP